MRSPLALVLFLALTGPTLAETAACRDAPAQSATTRALLADLNQQRRAAGLTELTPDPRLTEAARHHACDTARQNRIDHRGPDGSTPGLRARRHGYNWRLVAENLGLGFRSPSEAMSLWLGSPGHRANLLAAGATHIGLGRALTATDRETWVLLLAAPR